MKVKIIGAGGYGGVGIAELLNAHPEVAISALVDVENVGQAISDLYPHLKGFLDLPIRDSEDPLAKEPVDVVFMATPDGVGMMLAAAELAGGAKVIDYSGDFRFNSRPAYAEYAERLGRNPQHAAAELLSESVYGLTELHREEISTRTRIIGNPGCFAVSCLLGLAPAIRHGLIEWEGIICDCKTGVSGAGKKPRATFHYPERYDQMNAYRLAGHQHVCEIERELSLLAGDDLKVTFTAQVVPVCRGIMSTLYGELIGAPKEEELLEAYRQFYSTSPFIRVYDSGTVTGTMHVRGTNYCNLVVSTDSRTGRLRIVSYIDNLMKGQAGSALQNMNLILGFDETLGLCKPGIYP
jgi:N-acetyl-gamma-glutamyl-phosphate reductase